MQQLPCRFPRTGSKCVASAEKPKLLPAATWLDTFPPVGSYKAEGTPSQNKNPGFTFQHEAIVQQ